MNEFWRKLCDITGSDNYVSLFAEPGRKISLIDNYTYSVESTVAGVVQNVTSSYDVVMDSDSDFVCMFLAGFGRVAGQTDLIFNPAIMVQITDQASGRTWLNQPAPLPMLCGQGGFPFLLSSPRVIRPRSTLTVSATPAQATDFSGFYFSFHGARIFYA